MASIGSSVMEFGGGRVSAQEAWMEAGRRLGLSRLSHQGTGSQLMWEVGDWLLEGEDGVLRHKKRLTIRDLAMRLTGYSKHTLAMAVSVARKVRPPTRVDGLSWWHHLVVANLDEGARTDWLTRAVEYEWTVRKLREELRAANPDNGRSRPGPRNGDGVVRRLVGLRREQISDDLLAELDAWWRREMQDGEARRNGSQR